MSYRRREVDPIKRRVQESARKQQRKRALRIKQKKAKRRARLFFFLVLLLLGTGIFFGIRWIRATFLSASLTEDSTLRQKLNAAILTDMFASDTRGRELSAAEKTEDAEELASLLAKIPASLRLPDAAEPRATLESSVAQAASTKNDEDFYRLLQNMVASISTSAHFLSAQELSDLSQNIGNGFYEERSPYAQTLTDARVIDRYTRLGKLPAPKAVPRPKLTIDEATDTAILSGLSFADSAYPSQADTLRELITEGKRHRHFVLDLRKSGGTSWSYWSLGILPYLTQTTYGVHTSVFFPEGMETYASYLSGKESLSNFDVDSDRVPIANVKGESIATMVSDLSYFQSLTLTVSSDSSTLTPDSFAILTDTTTTGAAETFAAFCSRMAECTVYGAPTAGSPWQLPPFLFALKHSGYVLSLNATLVQLPDNQTVALNAPVSPQISLPAENTLSALLKKLAEEE